MALPSRKATQTDDNSLEDWQWIGSGGFGKVYKARHKTLQFDVAIKLPNYGDSSLSDQALWREASHMVEAANPYVLQVYGVYKGCPPKESSEKMGIVMEFMEKGSLQSLLHVLSSPPPWPLAFQLAHQVALGMNFLHEKADLLHKDLKPSNVLLDKDLNAKLADFGLSRSSTDTTEEEGGTLAYTPPEAFTEPYQPVRAYDIYSYGVLLWSVLTGKEPFPGAATTHVKLWTSHLDRRPPCDEINKQADGIGELADLMQKCWDREPSTRPPFSQCLKVTECVFLKHKKGIRDAVSQVLLKLESQKNQSPSNTDLSFSFLSQLTARSEDTVDRGSSAKTEGASKKDSVDMFTVKLSDNDKATFVDAHRATLIQEISVVMAITDDLGDLVHREMYARIEAKQTSQDKMRELYKTLHTGGLKVKAAFYNALSKNEPALLERLGG